MMRYCGVPVMVSAIIHTFMFCVASSETNETLLVGLTLVVTGNTADCNKGLTSPGDIYLQYRQVLLLQPSSETGPWNLFEVISLSNLSNSHHNFRFSVTVTSGVFQGRPWSHLQFRLIQLEHGGGYCNCWGVVASSWSVSGEVQEPARDGGSSFFRILEECGVSGSHHLSTTSSSQDTNLFCSGSASVPRGVISDVYNILDGSGHCQDGLTEVIEKKKSPLLNCDDAVDKVVLNFQLSMFPSSSSCGSLSGADKGVEVAIKGESDGLEQWIPLLYFPASLDRQEEIYIGDVSHTPSDTFTIRGYNVPAEIFQPRHKACIEICDGLNFESDFLQFRWLQTARFIRSGSLIPKDVWRLDYVNVAFSNGSVWTLLDVQFDAVHLEGIRNGALEESDVCGGANEENGLLFNGTMDTFDQIINDFVIASRSVTTAPISPGGDVVGIERIQQNLCGRNTSEFFSTTAPVLSTSYEMTTGSSSITRVTLTGTTLEESANDEDFLREEELYTKNKIQSNSELQTILDTRDVMESIRLLQNASARTPTSGTVLAYLFGIITDRLMNTSFSESTLQAIVDVGNNILQFHQESSSSGLVAATTVLEKFDTILFSYFPQNGSLARGNIVLKSTVVDINEQDKSLQITTLNTSIFSGSEGPQIVMAIPVELLKCGIGNGSARIVSGVYRNIAESLSYENATIKSDVVSASLQCGTGRCATHKCTLQSSSVSISFEHSSALSMQLMQNLVETTCVFLDVFALKSTTLNIGRWSDRGCIKNASLSSTSRTVCDCNHLTSFAILLSPKPPDFKTHVMFSHTITGYTGVTISVVAMALTVFPFTVLKLSPENRPLLRIRNWIHINLCISLSIAQIIFVVGVDKTGPLNGDVPTHCQVIAVLLHYFFLVSFMWMLMEGVVLYVALVRVFVTRRKSYIFAFTIISYGLPLLYMGLLTLPLGFRLPNRPHYGYGKACFLRADTNFVWAFIVPVILIFLANSGFFIMVAKIGWQQRMKKVEGKRIKEVKDWLLSVISLVVIMGLPWIIGIFVLEYDELAPLAYIYTIIVAFQGLFIFLVLVVFSKAVRKAYIKFWNEEIRRSTNSSERSTSSNLLVASKSFQHLQSVTCNQKFNTAGTKNKNAVPLNKITSTANVYLMSSKELEKGVTGDQVDIKFQ